MALALAAQRFGRQGGAVLPWLRSLTTTSSAQSAAPQPVPLSQLKDSFNDATSVTYLEELEKQYRQDPSSVDKTWASFFRNLGERSPRGAAFARMPGSDTCGLTLRRPTSRAQTRASPGGPSLRRSMPLKKAERSARSPPPMPPRRPSRRAFGSSA